MPSRIKAGRPLEAARLFAVLEFALASAPILKDKVITFFDVCSIFSLHYHYNLWQCLAMKCDMHPKRWFAEMSPSHARF
jgi:hypothetical protein